MTQEKFSSAAGKVVSVGELTASYMSMRSVRLKARDNQVVAAHGLLARERQARADFFTSLETDTALQATLRTANKGTLGLWKDKNGSLYASGPTQAILRHSVFDAVAAAGGDRDTENYAAKMIQLSAQAFMKVPSHHDKVGKTLKPYLEPKEESLFMRGFHKVARWVSAHIPHHPRPPTAKPC